MEDHELIEQYRRGDFSEDALLIAECVLQSRGLNPTNLPTDHTADSVAETKRPPGPILLPILFGVIAASILGRQIGAAIGGAVGAGITAALLFVVGYWCGGLVANVVRRQALSVYRFLISCAAVVAWVFVVGLVGLLAKVILK
jgi:hypothetical protein